MTRSFRSLYHRASLVAFLCLAINGATVLFAAQQPAIPVLSPASGAHDVCPDTPLRLTFDTTPALGAGKIQIIDTATNAPADTIDVRPATPANPLTLTKTIGGLPNFRYFPILITGNQATIYPNQILAYGKTYTLTIDAGVFTDGAGGALAVPDNWRFTTKAAPPAATTRLTVDAAGHGDFATIQGAIDFIPEGNTAPTTIFIKNGTYNELIFFTNKDAITLLGEDRKKSIIAYANSDRFNNNAGGNPFGTAAGPTTARVRTGAIYHRGLFLAHRVSDLTIANLTLHNTTPQGGSQAEAIILNGTTNARAILAGVDLYSFQDTLQINGQAYITDCYIEGDVDFMWGTGPCFFDNCQARALRSNAYYTQIRNPAANHGYVYKDCTFDGAPGITGNFLSRIAPARFPASEVVLLNCIMTDAVGPAAWRFDQATEGPNVHYREFNSHTPEGKPVDLARRFAASRQLQQPADADTIRDYSDPKFVLGGWSPTLAPIITSQPAAISFHAGQKATLTVATLAIPAPTYQWQRDGRDLPGATGPTLTTSDAGAYTVTITNPGGKVTSIPAPVSVTQQN